MEDLIKSVPKPILALGIIILGIIIAMLINPPKSICDTEQKALQQQLVGELYSANAGKKRGQLPAEIKKAKEQCKFGNSAGACFEYFRVLKKMSDGIDQLSTECYAKILEAAGVRASLQEGLQLMTQIAWGEEMQESKSMGWLTNTELVAFCHIKETLKKSMDESEWSDLNTSIVQILPGKSPPSVEGLKKEKPNPAWITLGEDRVFQQSLLSLQCEPYL